MIEVKAPNPRPRTKDPVVFLGGSIDMGKASDWRGVITSALQKQSVVFLNPWGDNFDVDTPQEAGNEKFAGQVNWELDGLEAADIHVFYFEPGGKSPVTMLELGMSIPTSKVVLVCCPDGFWRKGNIDIVCDRYGIKQVEDLDSLISVIKQWVKIMHDKML